MCYYNYYICIINLKIKIMNTLNFNPSTEIQVSALILDNLKPIEFRHDWDPEFKTQELRKFIRLQSLIFEIGEIEHTNDWDPSIILTYWDQDLELQTIETEPGYNVIEIDNMDLLIENELGLGHYDDEDLSYFRIPIKDIHSIQMISN